MKRLTAHHLTMTLATALVVAVGRAEDPPDRSGPRVDLVPAAAPVEGWSMDGEPQIFVGEELFELVNGGAERIGVHSGSGRS